MKGQVTAVVQNEADRTADMTVRVSTDAGVLLQTDTILLPIDELSKDLAQKRIIEHLEKVKLAPATFPYTNAQLETMLLNVVVRIPS